MKSLYVMLVVINISQAISQKFKDKYDPHRLNWQLHPSVNFHVFL